MEEPFTLVDRSSGHGHPDHHMFDEVVKYNSAKTADHDLPYLAALRKSFPEMIVTTCPEGNAPLRAYAASGYAVCEVDKDTDSYASWRGYAPPLRRSDKGGTGENVDFAKYHYKWSDADFILYLIGRVQYVLTEPRKGEHKLGPSAITDKLIRSVGEFFYNLTDVVWVYDGYWRQDSELFKEVKKASWHNVILDEEMKADLTSVAHKFFDSEAVYKDLGVPWKRGLLFYGPPGNGKTISIKALSNSMYQREKSIPTLYVKSAPYTWDIQQVFSMARRQAPCMLVLEDVETIVTQDTRSYFFNEMDGLANNDGLFIVGSTNFLDRLDPGLTKRPSRFDRKYLFPIPNRHERELYCEFWRRKLRPNKAIEFPKFLCPPMAGVTSGFSFAYLQECFTATLLIIAERRTDNVGTKPNVATPYDWDNSNDVDFNDYELWRVFDEQAAILKRQIGNEDPEYSSGTDRVMDNQMMSTGVSRPCPERTTGHHSPAVQFHTRDAYGVPLGLRAPHGMLEQDQLLRRTSGKGKRFTETAFETI